MNLEALKNKTVLLFGKPRAFSPEEFAAQMQALDITVVSQMQEDVILSIDGRMMTPYEQIASEQLYEAGKIPSTSIDTLESELVKNIDADTLLMSLKLSHDKERLKSFLQNSKIDDTLFFRLIKMYDWKGEDFFENDDNRDVSAAFIGRFYENIERNHNVQYATTGFIHLVSQAKSAKLLQAIAQLQPLSFHPKIKAAIAMSEYLDASMQKKFAKQGGEQILEALSFNKNLTGDLIETFLQEEHLALNVVRFVQLDDVLFAQFVKEYKAVAANETLTLAMQKELLALEDDEINRLLANNSSLEHSILKALLEKGDASMKMALYANSATPQELLQEAYENAAYHEALAKNENTPVEILYQLHLDSRYEKYVKSNAGFGEYIQSENIGWMVE